MTKTDNLRLDAAHAVIVAIRAHLGDASTDMRTQHLLHAIDAIAAYTIQRATDQHLQTLTITKPSDRPKHA